MKRDRNFAGKGILLGMIATITMTLCGCGDRARDEAVSLEDLRQKIEVRKENANAESGASDVVIVTNVPEEEVPEGDASEGDIQEENVLTQVLLDKRDIAQIQIVNGSNGERITLTEGDCFEQILNFYEQLRIAGEGERNQIVGYTYSLTFYDSQSHELQTMVPRSGKVVLDSMVYAEDGSNVGNQLNQYIAENYTEIRPVCIEIPYPPENLD